MQTYYLRCQLLIVATIFLNLTACESNPSHRPTIGGAIKLVDNKEKGLCFLPNFETAYLTSTKKYEDLKFINLSHVDVTRGDDPLSNKLVWQASTAPNQFYKLKEGESICMSQHLSELNVRNYSFLNNDKYTVTIRGMDDKKEYNLRFIERFVYPIK